MSLALLLLLGTFVAAAEPETSKPFNYCSIGHSAMVLKEAEKYFLEAFRGYSVAVSPQCPFYDLALVDEMYGLRSFEKRHILAGGKTECPRCQKIFKSNDYFEWHMWEKHLGLVPPDESLCLSNLCDIFDCEGKSKGKSSRKVTSDEILMKTIYTQREPGTALPFDK